MDRHHGLFCVAVCLVTAVCFAAPVLLLFFGILYLPFFLLGLIRDPATTGPPVALTLLGTAGIVGVVRVLLVVCKRHDDAPRALTLATLACGVAAALVYANSIATHATPTPFGAQLLIVYLPLACTLLLVYLARRPLLLLR